MELNGKVVVVTGGASGIGTGLCRRFREEGVRALIIADLNGEAVADLADELDAVGVTLDVRDEAAIAAMVSEVEAQFGQIDLFCSNAGILNLDGGDFWATSSANEVWQANWEIHVMAHVYAARACSAGDDSSRRRLFPAHHLRGGTLESALHRCLCDDKACGHWLCRVTGH